MEVLANTFGCMIGSFPFTYLGLPMATTKLRVEDFSPLMDKIERRLTACSSMLSYTGRLQMVNYVLTSTAAYAMCTLKLPKGVIDNIDRARKQCLWRGPRSEKKGGNLVAWPIVLLPNLSVQNDALLLKHLHKFYNRDDIPWANLMWSTHYENKVPHASREVRSFWWKDVLCLNPIFRSFARCTRGNGTTVTFWEDKWGDQVLAVRFPSLVDYARDRDISVRNFMNTEDLDTLFALPLSQEAFDELNDLSNWLELHTLNDDSKDVWSYQW